MTELASIQDLANSGGSQGPSDPELPKPLESDQLARISWAHFLELIRIEDLWKRAFYENELLQGH